MYAAADLQEYLDEVREQVCRHCTERPPGGPPCAPLGKMCGIETHLSTFVDAIHAVDSPSILPYLNSMHERVCPQCPQRGGDGCPCPSEYLLVLTVQAIETVDQRHRRGSRRVAQADGD